MAEEDIQQVLDQLLGFRQALEAVQSTDDLAALTCRMAERLTGAAEARLCLGGVLLPLPGEFLEACTGCPNLGAGGAAVGECSDLAANGCAVGGRGGWRSVPVCTVSRLYGFLLVREGTGGALAVSVAGIAAMVLENRELVRKLTIANHELRDLRDEFARCVLVQGGEKARSGC